MHTPLCYSSSAEYTRSPHRPSRDRKYLMNKIIRVFFYYLIVPISRLLRDVAEWKGCGLVRPQWSHLLRKSSQESNGKTQSSHTNISTIVTLTYKVFVLERYTWDNMSTIANWCPLMNQRSSTDTYVYDAFTMFLVKNCNDMSVVARCTCMSTIYRVRSWRTYTYIYVLPCSPLLAECVWRARCLTRPYQLIIPSNTAATNVYFNSILCLYIGEQPVPFLWSFLHN